MISQNNLAINQEQSYRIDAEFSRFLGIVLCSLYANLLSLSREAGGN